jgi:hypothetical protein
MRILLPNCDWRSGFLQVVMKNWRAAQAFYTASSFNLALGEWQI